MSAEHEAIPLSGSGKFPVVSLPAWLYGMASGDELAVLGALQLHYPNIRPSVQRIADKAGWSRAHVYKVLDGLIRKGWVHRTNRSTPEGRSLPNSYELRIWPSAEQMAQSVGVLMAPPAPSEAGCSPERPLPSTTETPPSVHGKDTRKQKDLGVHDVDTGVHDVDGGVSTTWTHQGPRRRHKGFQEQEHQEQEERTPQSAAHSSPPQPAAAAPTDFAMAVDDLGHDPGQEPPPKKQAKRKPADPFASRQLPGELIPDELLDCQQLLAEWWSVKPKNRTEVAFNRACNLLRQYTPDERRQVLETAIIGGHQGLYPPRQQYQQQRRPVNIPGRTAEGLTLAEAWRKRGLIA
jgi:hypothetical protein